MDTYMSFVAKPISIHMYGEQLEPNSQGYRLLLWAQIYGQMGGCRRDCAGGGIVRAAFDLWKGIIATAPSCYTITPTDGILQVIGVKPWGEAMG